MPKTIKKKTEKTFTEMYSEVKIENSQLVSEYLDGKNQRLNNKGKQYFVFPHVEEHGFDTWQKIYDEIVLIIGKKSTQPKAVRESLITLYNNITKRTIEFNKQS